MELIVEHLGRKGFGHVHPRANVVFLQSVFSTHFVDPAFKADWPGRFVSPAARCELSKNGALGRAVKLLSFKLNFNKLFKFLKNKTLVGF